MDLLLWRHADAEDGSPDRLRKLTPHGERQARWMADWIKVRAPHELRIVVSPATRCQQTAQALGLPFKTDPRLGTSAGVAELLTATGWHDEADGTARENQGAVLAVGHQPTLGQTVARLYGGGPLQNFPKGALLWLSWRTNTPATVHSFVIPDIG